MDKILSISIAAYNAAGDIKKCLDSMLSANVAGMLDIIVVNDGSEDDTAEIVKGYVEKHPDIVRLIDKENGGHGSTINASIKAATGKYYKIVDSDDWVDREGIERLTKLLLSESSDLILNPYYIIDAETGCVNEVVKPYKNGQDIGKNQSITDAEAITLYMHSVTLKTDVVRKMGAIIDEKCFYVDMEYTIFPMQFVETFLCLDFPVYAYLMGTSVQSMNIKNLIARRDEHLRVTKRIISFYHENKGDFKDSVRLLVLHRVKLATLNQYKIYFNMDSKEAVQEVCEFDNWLKKHDCEVYAGANGRFMKIIKFNRATKYVFYNVIVNCMKMICLEPKL